MGVTSPEVSIVRPRFSARGSSVSVASSATRDRSTCSRANDRWSARLSRSSASVRSIARVLTACRRSTSSPVSRVRVVAGDVEKGLRDRQRRAQLVGGVGRESLLLGDVRLEPREHGVEAVGELAELVLRPGSSIRCESDPVAASACGVGDARQRGEHAAGEEPSSHADRTRAGTPSRRPRSERKRAGGRRGCARRRSHPGAHRARGRSTRRRAARRPRASGSRRS